MKIKEQTNPSEYELFKEILSRHPEFLEKFCIENDASEQGIDIAKNKSVKMTEAEDDDTSSKLMDNLKINLMEDGIENTNFITGKIFASYIFRKIKIVYVVLIFSMKKNFTIESAPSWKTNCLCNEVMSKYGKRMGHWLRLISIYSKNFLWGRRKF